MFITIKIAVEKLNELRMLADWQLRQLGYCPESITQACLDVPSFGRLEGK